MIFLAFSGLLRGNEVVQQERVAISGVIRDYQGNPVPGANVLEVGYLNGTASDHEGHFSLRVFPESQIQVSFVGFVSLTLEVGSRRNFEITLEEDEVALDDVVVTALGIVKKISMLPYSTSQVDKDDLIQVKDPNMLVSLMGKISGMEVFQSASGLGGSVKVNLRGTRSVAGNNQPLYVLDGIPLLNNSPEQAANAIGGTADAANRDGGDGISLLNPEDIESISILKGASAAALYGTQAANGVVLINSRSGQKGKQEINFSTSLQFEKPMSLPRFQNRYGVSDKIESWGEKSEMPAYDNAGDFFETGVTAIQSLVLSSGNDRVQTYFSYGNTTARGIVPHHRLSKHNINFKESATFYEGRMRLEGNVNLVYQRVKNRPTPGGFYMNPLVGLYRFPRGEDIGTYRDRFEVQDEARNLFVQNWHSSTQDFEQNPYWVVNRISSNDKNYRVVFALKGHYDITHWLNAQGRVSVDYSNSLFRQCYYASTAPALAGANGRYIHSDFRQMQVYGDCLLQAKGASGEWSYDAALGAGINQNTTDRLRYDSKTGSLKIPNIFTIANVVMGSSAYIEEQQQATRQIQSVFATVQVGYGKQVSVDLSARNDWSSTLSFTSHEKSGFFYPSAGLSWLLSETFRLPEAITFGKLRAAWSMVGNDVPLFITNPLSKVIAGGDIQPPDSAPFKTMVPEKETSVEFGTEWYFFNNRLKLDATWYQSHTRNQFFTIPSQTGDDYAYRYVNAGNIRNRGVELELDGRILGAGAVNWRSSARFSRNRNKVLALHEEVPVFTYGPSGFSSSYAMKLVVGGAIGDIYGKAFERDEAGEILYETEGPKAGLPKEIGEGNTIRVGHASPRFRLSWNHTVSWNGLTAYVLLDGRFGGNVLSQTQADLDMFGVTRATGDARDRGYVELEGRQITDVKGFYKLQVGGRAGVTEHYIYDATNIRLRELSLGYALPKRWVNQWNIRDIHLSFVARNLFFLYKKAPFDPDLVLSTGNDNQAIEAYGMPTTRSMGFSLRVIL